MEDSWKVEIDENGTCTISCGHLKGTISKEQINDIRDYNIDQIDNLKVKIEIERAVSGTKFKFLNNKCEFTLKDLVRSLNNLKKSLRVNKKEHLFVEIIVGDKIIDNRYINLGNSLIYKKIGNSLARSNKDNKGNYNIECGPYFGADGRFYSWERDYGYYISGHFEDIETFNTPIFEDEDIKKFNLVLKN